MVGKEKYLLLFLGVLLAISLTLATVDIDMETAVDLARAVCVVLALFFVGLIIFVRIRLKRAEKPERAEE